MSLEESRRSQRPYRYGMVLLCVGALINWLGLAENYVEPVRYVGVACIVAGALLICAAMCCWLHAPPTRSTIQSQTSNPANTIQVKSFKFNKDKRIFLCTCLYKSFDLCCVILCCIDVKISRVREIYIVLY